MPQFQRQIKDSKCLQTENAIKRIFLNKDFGGDSQSLLGLAIESKISWIVKILDLKYCAL